MRSAIFSRFLQSNAWVSGSNRTFSVNTNSSMSVIIQDYKQLVNLCIYQGILTPAFIAMVGRVSPVAKLGIEALSNDTSVETGLSESTLLN